MEVILLERIEKLGQMGDVVKVKPGYARNYLLPEKKALRSSKENLAIFEAQKAQLEAANLKRKAEAEQISEKMASLKLVVIRQAAETGQLYGSVTGRDIRDAIREADSTLNAVRSFWISRSKKSARSTFAFPCTPMSAARLTW